MMNEHKKNPELEWEKGWEGHEKAQFLRMMKMPFVEKIKWLEQAQSMIEELKQRNRHPTPNENVKSPR